MTNLVSEEHILSHIKNLVSIPSPSGYAEEAISHAAHFLEKIGVNYKIANKGALIATIEGKDTSIHRLLTAHVDTLGAIVKEIKSSGRLKLSKIGGFHWNAVEGEYCKIHTAEGKIYTGTILIHETAAHVYKNSGDIKRDDESIEVRIDEVVKSKDETEKLGISVGDFVTFETRTEITDSGFIKSRHLDDKASVGILMHIMQLVKENNISLPYTTHFLISNNEEIGYGGNSNITPETVEYLAVDMGAIGDGQATDEFTVSICVKDSSGPYHYRLRQHLVELAKTNDIEYKLDIYPYYSSDASAAISAGHDIVHGLIGPGIDASHAFERTHVSSLKHTANLVLNYIQSDLA
ncbi:putative aminopeptidase FrvX [Peribacillus deserti]|uniref:Aminopeptidase FrvX n=1 Tax=Peribacillus deserti TaxID=673318 RepID=A0ABS2QJW1_9BACI|nr:M42 family metallopeptidase [Peribacillus deserti]MBM7693387.1 putative aminopeptidase FrvX [Peribacillus deserti]